MNINVQAIIDIAASTRHHSVRDNYTSKLLLLFHIITSEISLLDVIDMNTSMSCVILYFLYIFGIVFGVVLAIWVSDFCVDATSSG